MKKDNKVFKAILYVELIGILCVLAFALGHKVGADAERKEILVEVAGNKKIYQSSSTEQMIQSVDKNEQGNGKPVDAEMDVSGNTDESGNADVSGNADKSDNTDALGNTDVSGNNGAVDNVEMQGEADNEASEHVKVDLLLVNKSNALPKDYKVTLKTLPDGVNQAAEEAYQPLCDMLKAGRKEGLNFEICSSYRDVKRQRELFDEDMKTLIWSGKYSYSEAYEEVARETMPPGHSEHSTGLAFDIVALGYQMLDEGQEKTAENEWLQEHCAEYGFILRYPKGKEDITNIDYESWHYRYVGVEAATYIMENGLTLEEYLEG